MLLKSEAFPDASLEEIPLDCATEEFLRDRDEYPVAHIPVVRHASEPDASCISG